uniref:Fibronectin type-III domain-containing protein n=1 Tax=Labrus bergylta TaxID=56723 RepID=A0A3Q3FC03_9LABR
MKYVSLHPEPCAPMNLSVHYNASSARVMWEAAKGAISYSVQAVTDQGSTVTCNSTNTSCRLNGLQCSQLYNLTVTNIASREVKLAKLRRDVQLAPFKWGCFSNPETIRIRLNVHVEPYPGQHIKASFNLCIGLNIHFNPVGPCQTSSIEAIMDCEAHSATISWQPSVGTESYVTELTASSGHSTSCTTNYTHCELSSLKCGEEYNVSLYNLTVSAQNLACNNTETSQQYRLMTGSPPNFSLTAVVDGNLQTLCATQQNICNVTGLSCGETYNLSLTGSNTQCSLTAPMHFNLTTRPCPPKHVAVNLQCGSRTAVLSWEERSDVELYVASAIKASGGEVQHCNSTNSTCQFSSLDCGEMYNFTATAHSQGCSSTASSTVFIQTGTAEPCPPVIMSAQGLCQSEEVQIFWRQVRGVVNYLITATGSLGYVETFNTTQNQLLAALPCGQDYNVTVKGQGSECDTPCIPRHVTTYVQCESNMGSVSWGPSDGAETYVAIATGLDGHTHKCLTNTTSCTWNDLHCGEEYTVLVRAKGDNCTSLPSNSTVIHMGMLLLMDCENNTAVMSWSASRGAVKYSVTAIGRHNNVSCLSSDLSCSLGNLTCGSRYTAQVAAMDDNCSSIPSQAVMFNSGNRNTNTSLHSCSFIVL